MLSIIIIIMETEFCHLTLLTKKGKNHVLTAEELKNGWLFSDTNTPPLSEIVTVPPPHSSNPNNDRGERGNYIWTTVVRNTRWFDLPKDYRVLRK